MNLFLLGAIAALFFVAGGFFLRFWRQTGDRLHLKFSIAISIMGANQFALAAAHPDEASPLHYVVRLIAFLFILWAIIEKNRG